MFAKKLLVVAIASTVLTATAVAQDCNSCKSSSYYYPTSNAGCNTGCKSGCGTFSDYLQDQRDRFELITRRNYAWPKPFICQSRQTYMTIWQTAYDAGWQVEHTLSDIHFDSDSNELNKVGKARVAGIMQNAPAHRRTIYIYQGAGEVITNQRIKNAKDAIAEWWGFAATPQIVSTTYNPQGMSGSHAYQVNDMFSKGMMPPVLSTSSEGGTATGGN